MTHEEAIREAAANFQFAAACNHRDYRRYIDGGNSVMAVIYSRWAAENAAIARALMKIEGGEA